LSANSCRQCGQSRQFCQSGCQLSPGMHHVRSVRRLRPPPACYAAATAPKCTTRPVKPPLPSPPPNSFPAAAPPTR
jgi:hypothetical protein